MHSNLYGLIELIFTGGVVLAFLGWQYWSVNREIARDKRKAKPPTPESDA
ncbi:MULTISPECIES: hypothetical protein [unclassified Sphingomonas]|jgi:threonine/homoserine/homoserine lactone efflux protein|nr:MULTISPECIES: hypothetical protein [unclassified Sphingomonas]MCH4891949.1 hypothetical protein [Sphingomonas sp. SFZ2018-12]